MSTSISFRLDLGSLIYWNTSHLEIKSINRLDLEREDQRQN